MRSIREVMESKNVVVYGASKDHTKAGAMLLDALSHSRLQGRIAGINPKGGEVHGVKLYPAIEDVPFEVDLASIIIPPKAVPAAVSACARNGVRGVIISSEGFAESGEEGGAIQAEIRAILKSSGMRGFGPNTLGIINTETGLTTSYFSDHNMLSPGSIGVVSQSGAFVGALLKYLSSFPVYRISKGLGLGNKIDVDEVDALDYLKEDDQTRVIGLYLEDIRDGRRFVAAAREAVKHKPVLLLKGGRTREGSRAAASHTASLAVEDRILQGALHQAGVLSVKQPDELMAAFMGFQWAPLPKGNNLAYVTYSGAQAIMCVDATVEEGLSVARFSKQTDERLSQVIATRGKRMNPIDIYPDMNRHGFEKTTTRILKALLADDEIHGIIFIGFAADAGKSLFQPHVEMIKEKQNKPVFFSVLGAVAQMKESTDYLLAQRLPVYLFPETGVRVFSKMRRYAITLEQADQPL